MLSNDGGYIKFCYLPAPYRAHACNWSIAMHTGKAREKWHHMKILNKNSYKINQWSNSHVWWCIDYWKSMLCKTNQIFAGSNFLLFKMSIFDSCARMLFLALLEMEKWVSLEFRLLTFIWAGKHPEKICLNESSNNFLESPAIRKNSTIQLINENFL